MENAAFFSLLNHSWTPIIETNAADAFYVGVWTRNTIADALVSIFYGEDGNVYAHISLIGDRWSFPLWTIKSILDDVKKIILRRGAYRVVEGEITIEKGSDSFTLALDDEDINVTLNLIR